LADPVEVVEWDRAKAVEWAKVVIVKAYSLCHKAESEQLTV